jgi:hypothetical protein
MSALIESISKCRVDGNIVHLPPITDGPLPNYNEVRTALIKAGGKYKKNTFVFPNNAQSYIDRLTGGETVNIQKEFQFFATPARLAERMVDMAELSENDGRGFGTILEPSAGQGAIIKAIHDATGGATVICYELMDINREILKKIKGASLIGDDFIKADRSSVYDRIIANPPFTKNQDIDHIRLMYDLLAPGGIIVTLSSISWKFGSQKKQVQFREWLYEVDAHIEEIPENTFKESGTSIKTMLIKIRK